jgi:Flp pilus assembly pilin Flp
MITTVSNERGMAVEYVLLTVLAALAAIFIVYRFGGTMKGRFDAAGTAVNGAKPEGGRSSGGYAPGQIADVSSGAAPNEPSTQEAAAPPSSEGQASEGIAVGNFRISWSMAIWLGILVIVVAMLMVMRMAKSAKEAGKAGAKELAISLKKNSQSGQAMLEFFLAFLVGIMLILGSIQVALMFNAKSMVKLAAFNAARAAIVARDSADRTQPVDIDEMKKKAKLAAFLTLIPVIPSVQGRFDLNSDSTSVNLSATDMLNNLTSNFDTDSSNPSSTPAFGGLGSAAVAVAGLIYEFVGKTIDDNANPVDCIDVKFVDPETGKDIDDWPSIEFDDPQKAAENRIKIQVTWQYPLVVPFVNRIITAGARPHLYDLALTAAGDPLLALNKNKIHPWAYGASLDKLSSASIAGISVPGNLNNVVQSLVQYLLYRVPISDTYVMRMQWDRKPKS